MSLDPKPIIDAYMAAYVAANCVSCPYAITYNRGWFTFSGRAGWPTFRKRAVEVDQLTSCLIWRAQQ